MEVVLGLHSKWSKQSDAEIMKLKKEWRKQERIKLQKIKDQLERINQYDYDRLTTQVELEQADLMNKKKELEDKIKDIDRQIIKKPRKKKEQEIYA